MKTRYVVALLVGLFVLALLADRNTGMFNTDRVRWMAAINWAMTTMGTAVAAISAFRPSEVPSRHQDSRPFRRAWSG